MAKSRLERRRDEVTVQALGLYLRIRLVYFMLPESTACRLRSWLDFPISDPNSLIRVFICQ